jgi:hypothetical protein
MIGERAFEAEEGLGIILGAVGVGIISRVGGRGCD